jgi:hypothetical protein
MSSRRVSTSSDDTIRIRVKGEFQCTPSSGALGQGTKQMKIYTPILITVTGRVMKKEEKVQKKTIRNIRNSGYQ